MAQATVDQRIAPRNPVEYVIDRTWRFFCSVRIAVAEIAFLALLVLIGTLRGSSVPESIAQLVPFTRGLVDVWYAWDVFRSLIFMATLAIISVAITICTINRVPGIWAAIANPTVTTTHGFLRNAERSGHVTSQQAPAELAAITQESLRKSGYRTRLAERRDEIHLYADRFHWAKLGTFPFHMALILILLGGIVGARWGFRELEFIVPEESVREIGHDTGLSLQLNDFVDTYTELGIPSEYRSEFTILRHGEPLESASITVNKPFTYGDLTIYQAGFGQAVVMQITDADGDVRFDDAVPLGQFRSTDNPDAPAAVMDLVPIGLSMTVIAPDENPVNEPELDKLNLRSGQMYVLLRPTGLNSPIDEPMALTLDQGSPAAVGDFAVTFVRERRFSAFQVARNPGITIFYGASIILVAGLAVTFYFPHRRVRGIISPTAGGGSRMELAPLARRDWSGQQAFERLLATLETRLGTPITRIERAERPGTQQQGPSPPANASEVS